MAQQTLFDTDQPEWEADAAAEQFVATVVLSSGPAVPFDYRVPDTIRAAIGVGYRVRVPFGRGNRLAAGYCVALDTQTNVSRRLKEIHELIDDRPILSPTILRLTKWMSDYYLCPWNQAIETVIPAGVRTGAGSRLTTFLHVPQHVAARLDELKLPQKQAAALRHLAGQSASMTPAQLAAAVGCTQAPVNSLRRKGLIASEVRRVRKQLTEPVLKPPEKNLAMHDDQQAALDAIVDALRRGSHETILVHGVTGSGKTEVYMQAIQEVISYGRQAIVLVPEISLTPQTEARFRSRFGRVAVLHSHLTDVERHQHWELISSGAVSVVVGARSAVFAPTPQLGLIVIDEEHETSFKQEMAPRYHARDVALRRAADERVPLVLGAATPSLESFSRARQGEYRLVRMPRRVFDRPLPAVATIDLRVESQDRHSRGAISRQLHTAMDRALRAGGQVILLLNRRGFSTQIQCPSCGEALRCPDCEIALTHHKQARLAVCHYCDYRRDVPQRCTQCGFTGIRFWGRGTQRLEEEVQVRFPDFPCLRMDTDSMQARGSHEAALARFRSGEIRILLGTQMIAKGLDFPDVTLVGVINADTALHLPDFRAAERTFQLVTQVAGRTGRSDRGGRVLVQTFQPDHMAIRAAICHDYEAFALAELPERQKLGYPPFGSMVRIVARGTAETAVKQFAVHLGDRVRGASACSTGGVRVLGPAAPPLAKLRGKYRFALQLQSTDTDLLHRAVREAVEGVESPRGIQFTIDVDPVDMM